MKHAATILLGLLALGTAACSVEEKLSPLPQPKGDVPPAHDAGPDGSGGGGGAPAPKRTISFRSPLGEPAANLFVDGDFEMSTSYDGSSDQLGWRSFDATPTSQRSIPTVTGGVCRTGLRCGWLEPKRLYIVQGTSAGGGQGVVASIWIKPEAGTKCDDVASFQLYPCDGAGVFAAMKGPKEPGPDGWCELSGQVGAKDTGVCLYIETKLATGKKALFDSAVMLPDTGMSAKQAIVAEPLPADLVARVDAMREFLRQRRRFDRGIAAPRDPSERPRDPR